MNHGCLLRIAESVDYLNKIVTAQAQPSPPGLERLLDAYIESKKILSKEFMAVFQTSIDDLGLLENTRAKIEHDMAIKYQAVLPAKYFKIGGYKGCHSYLLNYLAKKMGSFVSSSRLRVLTGDQIHTERRVRELRDFGFDINWKAASGENQYILSSTPADIDFASRYHAEKNIKRDGSISPATKASYFRDIGI